jgi:primary-amine oxidase
MAIGTRWEMCWERDGQRGLVLNQISFTPKNGSRTLILGSAALAQIYVAYDDASQTKHYLSDTGMNLTPLTASDCPNGVLRQDNNGNSVLCQIVRARGYAWRGTGHVLGQSLVIFAVSHVENDSYIHQWVFSDDGTIMPMLGVSGRLDGNRISNASTGWPLGNGNTRYATSRFHTAYWRLNFDIGGSANDVVEQFDYSGTGTIRTQSISTIWQETSRAISPLSQRFWRVKDAALANINGRNISYQIVPQQAVVQRGSEGFTRNDVYVTTHKACELFASRNSAQTGCAADVTAFANGEPVTDVVVWVGTTWHQVARDEDEPFMPVHWQSITLMPRNFLATSPLQ